MHACRSCPRVPLPLVIIPSPAEAERAGGGDAGFVCSALLRRRGHPGGVRPQAVPSARFCSVRFPRGSFPPSPSWSPRPPGTPRGTPARSKRRDRDARGRWFAFPFRSSLPAAHDDREQSAAKTDGRVSPSPPRTRPRDRRNITLGPSARDQRTGRVDRYRHCAGWRRGPSGRDVTVAAARARRRPSFVSGAGRAAFSFGKFVDFYLYCI